MPFLTCSFSNTLNDFQRFLSNPCVFSAQLAVGSEWVRLGGWEQAFAHACPLPWEVAILSNIFAVQRELKGTGQSSNSLQIFIQTLMGVGLMKERDNKGQLKTFTESLKVKGKAMRPGVTGCFSGYPKSLGPLGTSGLLVCPALFQSCKQHFIPYILMFTKGRMKSLPACCFT